MSKKALGVDINIPGISLGVVDLEKNTIVPGTVVKREINANESLENLLECWEGAFNESLKFTDGEYPSIGIGMPGPFDYEAGISLMTNQNKFEALYRKNVKELIAARLGISVASIKMQNVAPCAIKGEVIAGAGRGISNVMGFTLNYGLGSGLYVNGNLIDPHFWNKPFKDGIAEDYLGIQWMSRRYEEFTGLHITDLQDLAKFAKTDDGIGQLVFNEYGENFFKFLIEQVETYKPEAILIGGHDNVWNLFIPHVKDRLSDKNVNIPIIPAELGENASVIGAASLWA